MCVYLLRFTICRQTKKNFFVVFCMVPGFLFVCYVLVVVVVHQPFLRYSNTLFLILLLASVFSSFHCFCFVLFCVHPAVHPSYSSRWSLSSSIVVVCRWRLFVRLYKCFTLFCLLLSYVGGRGLLPVTTTLCVCVCDCMFSGMSVCIYV